MLLFGLCMGKGKIKNLNKIINMNILDGMKDKHISGRRKLSINSIKHTDKICNLNIYNT